MIDEKNKLTCSLDKLGNQKRSKYNIYHILLIFFQIGQNFSKHCRWNFNKSKIVHFKKHFTSNCGFFQVGVSH